MKLDSIHLRALSECEGPLRVALERAFMLGVPRADLTWDLAPETFLTLREPATRSQRLHVRGWEVWNTAAGWAEDSEAIMSHAAGLK